MKMFNLQDLMFLNLKMLIEQLSKLKEMIMFNWLLFKLIKTLKEIDFNLNSNNLIKFKELLLISYKEILMFKLCQISQINIKFNFYPLKFQAIKMLIDKHFRLLEIIKLID